MPQKNSGTKLRRCGRHKSMYAAQFYRTVRNKENYFKRIARRKIEIPHFKAIARAASEDVL